MNPLFLVGLDFSYVKKEENVNKAVKSYVDKGSYELYISAENEQAILQNLKDIAQQHSFSLDFSVPRYIQEVSLNYIKVVTRNSFYTI